jgi:predicted amidohydrolase YtcJ
MSAAVTDVTVVYAAGTFVTMEPGFPEVESVAVRDGRIVAVGSRAEVLAGLGDSPVVVDQRFADQVVMPGFIDQHLHPILGATTLATEVISTESWSLPDRSFPAAATPDEYRRRLQEADRALATGDEWLFSWGYHELWHGPLDRHVLDEISGTRPIGVWQRSCHEWFLNTVGIEQLEITEAGMAGHGEASTMVDVAAGHWWEAGLFTLLFPKLAGVFLTPPRLTRGLRQMVAYLHQNGVTAFNEPGIVWAAEPFELYQQILGADDTPMLSTFLVDARSQAEAGMDPSDAVADAERQVAIAPEGKVSIVADQVKLFADGAIISQLMQMRDGYVDGDGAPDPDHVGEWLMAPDVLRAFARVYWDAGWQLHIHVNGDLGLDVVLDVLESCMVAQPRADHRSVIVHFANSTEQQVDRIARLGAIVSANPYYPSGFADKYAERGLGPDRADSMVRSASALARSIPLSFHSDLPMGPAEPLKLVWCAVNRLTQSGRVAAPEQRISIDQALRAVTIEAAYSWRREHDLGSIAPGKIANFTVLADDPRLVEPTDLDKIPVLGTVFEGRWFPVEGGRAAAAARSDGVGRRAAPSGAVDGPHEHGGSCSCLAARKVAAAVGSPSAAA